MKALDTTVKVKQTVKANTIFLFRCCMTFEVIYLVLITFTKSSLRNGE